MIKLYAAPRTRSIRIAWLLEELKQDYELILGTFKPTPSKFFIQDTPTGKYPTIDDGGLVLMESGAIVEYLLEKFDNQLMAPPGSEQKAKTLQWLHYADATAFSPLGIVIWLGIYRQDSHEHPGLLADAKNRASTGLEPISKQLEVHPFIAGEQFSAADIMMGFTVLAADMLGLVEDDSIIKDYIQRLIARPAFQSAAARIGEVL